MNDKRCSKKFWLLVIGISIFLFGFSTFGFVAFANRKEEVIVNEETGGNIIVNYSSNFSGLNLQNIVRTTDSLAKKTLNEGEYFDFSVMTSLDNATEIDYEITLIKDLKKTSVKDDDIKIYLEQEKSGTYTSVLEPVSFSAIKKSTKLGSPTGSMVLFKTQRKKSVDDKYRLRVWLADTSLLENGNIYVELQVYGKAI